MDVDSDNAEGTNYCLLRCTKPKHKLPQVTKNSYGETNPSGLVVVEATHYQQTKTTKNGVQFIDYTFFQKILHYSHLVIMT